MWLVEPTTELLPGVGYQVKFKDGHIQEIVGNNLQFYKRSKSVKDHFKKKVRKGSFFIKGKKTDGVGYDSDEEENEYRREQLERQQEKSERSRQKAFRRYNKKTAVSR